MPRLTPQQQSFLQDFLNTRAREKGQLGGRKLRKIENAYKDYCRRQQKVLSVVSKLRALTGGAPLADDCEVEIGLVERQVAIASDLGDESVFPVATEQLAIVEKRAKQLYDERKAALKKVAAEQSKFQQALQKVTRIADADKRAQAAMQLRNATADWLRSHHGPEKQGVWSVYQEAITLAGDVGKFGLALVAQEVEREAFELAKRVDAADVNELTEDTHGYKALVNDLVDRVAGFIEKANQEGDGFHRQQLERTAAIAARLKWLVDPAPPPEEIAPPPPQPGGGNASQDNVQDVADQQLASSEELSNAEFAAQRLKETAKTLERVEEEFTRVESAFQGLAGSKENLEQQVNAVRERLEDELHLLNNEYEEAAKPLAAAKQSIAAAREKYASADASKDQEGVWETHVQDAATDIEDAYRHLATCEKLMGQVEGGLTYIRGAASSIESFAGRVEKLDGELLETVKAKLNLFAECDRVPAVGAEHDMVKHLMLTAALPAVELTQLLRAARDPQTLKVLIRQLMDAPKIGTLAITGMLASCHQLVADADRYYGDQMDARGTLSSDLAKKFETIYALSKQDLAKYTVPVIAPQEGESTKGQQSVGVAIIGGGPIGLLAAIEARMGGASQVNVYEGRQDPYSRLNVLKIDFAPARRLITAGVGDAVFPLGYGNAPEGEDAGVASVKTIENALEARCKSLGINLERGLFLKDVTRNEKGKVVLCFQGQEDQPKTCDLLIVATGASVANAQKHADKVVLADVLGIPFQKSQVKDYAEVGFFDRRVPKNSDQAGAIVGWKYKFVTSEVKYYVGNLSEEEFNEFNKNPRKLIDKIQREAIASTLVQPVKNSHPVKESSASKDPTVTAEKLDAEIDRAWDSILKDIGPEKFHGSAKARERDDQDVSKAKASVKKLLQGKLKRLRDKGEEEKLSPAEVEDALLESVVRILGVSRFPIEIQQAKQFTSKEFQAVLVGDSAATPHPATGKGLNTGINEMGAVKDLVQGLRRGKDTDEDRKAQMQAYEFEVKRRTDIMVAAALNEMQSNTSFRLRTLIPNNVVPLIRNLVDPDTRERWKADVYALLNSLVIPLDEAQDDRDWSRREEAVRKTRAVETAILAAAKEIKQLVDSGETDPATLMAPLNKVLQDAGAGKVQPPPNVQKEEKDEEPDGDLDNSQQQSPPQYPEPAEPVIGSGLPPNPTLYFVPNRDDGRNFRVEAENPGEPWQPVGQFCSYLATYWLVHDMDGGLSFSDLSNPNAAIEKLAELAGDTTNIGPVNQVNYAKQEIGGQEVGKGQLLVDLATGKAAPGTKIWFGTDVHAKAAKVLPDGRISIYDPDDGVVQTINNSDFAAAAGSSNVFVVASP